MVITDRETIASATPLFPDMMSEGAEKAFIEKFNTLKKMRHELSELRVRAMTLEQELKPLEADFQQLSKMFDIKYKEKEIQEIKNECMLGVFNKDDARNW